MQLAQLTLDQSRPGVVVHDVRRSGADEAEVREGCDDDILRTRLTTVLWTRFTTALYVPGMTPIHECQGRRRR